MAAFFKTLREDFIVMSASHTPMMQQWQACKEQAGEALLLFRLGDFYEAFHEDAHLLSSALDLTLTKRQDIPMAGIPVGTADGYLDRLLVKGFRVAIAEQIGDPQQTNKLMKREIVRVITPGTAVDSSLIAEKACHYIVALTQIGHLLGLAVIETSTGSFKVTELEEPSALAAELAQLAPAEVLVSQRCEARYRLLLREGGFPLTIRPEWVFDHETARETLGQHFQVRSLDGFGMHGMVAAISAAGALVHYLLRELFLNMNHLAPITPYRCNHHVFLDAATARNLLLSAEGKDQRNTLLGVLDHTLTAMGGRLLREWVKRPLSQLDMILERQSKVALLHSKPDLILQLRQVFTGIRDLERLSLKVNSRGASPRDLQSLGHSLMKLPELAHLIAPHPLLGTLDQAEELYQLGTHLISTLCEEVPVQASAGQVIRKGICAELDELRAMQQQEIDYLARYQSQIRDNTGIKTLKVGYNRVFGYYIEVTRGQADRIPPEFVRKQTLSHAERFVSPELKDYEVKVLSANERAAALEMELLDQLIQQIPTHRQAIQTVAHHIAHLDAWCSLAQTARERGYCRPTLDESNALCIREGRHPIVEQTTHHFVANDTMMEGHQAHLFLITGPNMAGKSTYIRQVALLILMAQIGSFIPAQEARIGIVDRVFTRIGSGDDLARGQSTFMVEMAETANILHNATHRSLVILDEVGRGTSTYDGVSIAWAVAEYLMTQTRARTLFATHYFELTHLENHLAGVVNYNVAVREEGGQVIFTHQIVRGHADRSYGIHVARLAGLPIPVICRAQEILTDLESHPRSNKVAQKSERVVATNTKAPKQLTLFS